MTRSTTSDGGNDRQREREALEQTLNQQNPTDRLGLRDPKLLFIVALAALAVLVTYFLSGDTEPRQKVTEAEVLEEPVHGPPKHFPKQRSFLDDLKREIVPGESLVETDAQFWRKSAASGKAIRLDTPKPPTVAATKRAGQAGEYHAAGYNAPPPQNGRAQVAKAETGPYDDPTVSQYVQTVRPETLWHNQNRIKRGKTLTIIMERPIVSTFPSKVKGYLVEPVYAESGDQVLLPRYTELHGTAANEEIGNTQDRLGVMWEYAEYRVHGATDGIVRVPFESAVYDQLGRVGVAGKVNTFFWQRFGNALLTSFIGAVASNVGAATDDASNAQQAYIEAFTHSTQREAQRSLQAQNVWKPRIDVSRAIIVTAFAQRDILWEEGQAEGLR
ncbi:TrbI/VirB10 family protein [Candidatus Kaiserbacteria bacterium]|nr:TrbI/VirB10 family protein [Candidatus Kaiserbacteria bacterium]MCB9812457.1 TrbI/VirB10 family protein [Candidatus Nomurabacteria bacterium]